MPFCLDGNMGYLGVCICQNLLTGALKICAFCCSISTSKEKKTINKYWTLVNNICAEVFRGDSH